MKLSHGHLRNFSMSAPDMAMSPEPSAAGTFNSGSAAACASSRDTTCYHVCWSGQFQREISENSIVQILENFPPSELARRCRSTGLRPNRRIMSQLSR